MYVTPVSDIIDLDVKMSYVGFEPGAPLTANDDPLDLSEIENMLEDSDEDEYSCS